MSIDTFTQHLFKASFYMVYIELERNMTLLYVG